MVRNLVISAAFLFSAPVSASSAPLVVIGKYQNKNIYVQNSFNQNGVGFCAYEVFVNGSRTTDEVNSSAFEIDLRPFNLSIGDNVEIWIFHKDGCEPRVLNPESLKPRPTFKPVKIDLSDGGLLVWSVTNESGSLPFVVEQYRWKKWVFVGEVNGIGTAGPNTYSFQVAFHSGENIFRIKQVGFDKEVRYTPEVKYTPKAKDRLSFTQTKDTKYISLTGESLYEMFDSYGNVVLKGYGSAIDLSGFARGTYYLCFDNEVAEILKR